MKKSAIALVCTAVLAAVLVVPFALSGHHAPGQSQADQPRTVQDDQPGELESVPTSDAANEATGDNAPGDVGSGLDAVESTDSPDEPEYVPGEVLVGLADGVSVDEVNAKLASLDYVETKSVSEEDVVLGYVALTLADGVSVDEATWQLQFEDFTEAAQPNYIYHLLDEGAGYSDSADVVETEASAASADDSAAAGASFALQAASADMTAQETTINDPKRTSQWALEAVNAYRAWDYQRVNGTVTVAVLDSGIDTDHPDFNGKRIVGSYSVLKDSSNVNDLQGHGTHVAGIIAATSNNKVGVSGVSYNANIMPVQVIKNDASGTVTSEDAAAGIAYVIENAKTYNVRVINISFGSSSNTTSTDTEDRLFLNALADAHKADILVVCAAGNGGSTGAYNCFPCDFDSDSIGVINVAPSGSTYARSSTSNFNLRGQKTKELSAPGGDANNPILSTTNNGSYGNKYGTSMAAPYVSGIAALLFAADSSLSASQVKQTLISTAQDLNTVGFDLQTGYGLVDAAAALKAVGASAPTISGQDSVMKGSTMQLGIDNAGSGTWSWSSGDASVATVSASGVVAGVAPGSVTISASKGDVTLSQVVNVYDPTITGDAVVNAGTPAQLSLSDSNPAGTWNWSSSDTSVATVSSAGLVYARGVGEAVITVTLSTNSSVTSSFVINVGTTDLKYATLTGVVDQVYTGSELTLPDLGVRIYSSVGSRTGYTQLVEGTDYEVSYSNNIEKGDHATVTVTGKGNYEGSKTEEFRIGTYTVAKATAATNSTFAYNGSPITIDDLVVKVGDTQLSPETDYSLSYSNNTNAGTAYFTVKGEGEYVGSRTFGFTINAASINDVAISGITSKQYTGHVITQSPMLTYNGMTLVEGTDYRMAYSDNTNVGTASMVFQGLGNYATFTTYAFIYSIPITRTETFTITPASIATAKVSVESQAYTGSALKPTPTVTLDGTKLVEGTDYTVSYSNNKNVGTATVTVTGTGNYTGTAKGTFKILAMPTCTGATRMPVGAKATYSVSNGSLALKAGSAYATLSGKVLTAKQSGTVVLSVLDSSGVERSTMMVKVYDAMGYYRFSSAINTSYVLDVANASLVNGGNVQLYRSNSTAAQKWELTALSDGTYRVASASTGKALTVAGNSKANGANVCQKAWSGASSQRWRITVDASNNVTLINKKSGKALEVKGGKAVNGANVRQNASTSKNAQKWSLLQVSYSAGPIYDGEYRLTTAVNSKFALAVAGNSKARKANKANVLVKKASTAAAQRWQFVYKGSGYYKVTCKVSGKVLEVANSSKANKANVRQNAWKGTANQLWRVVVNPDGSITLINKKSGKALALSGTAKSGRNVYQYKAKYVKAQRWKIKQY